MKSNKKTNETHTPVPEFTDTEDMLFDTGIEKQSESPMNEKFKREIRKENKKKTIGLKRKAFREVLSKIFDTGKILRSLDFMLNVFAITAVVVNTVLTIKYFIAGDPYMTAVGCLLIATSIYLNEKIS